MKLSPKQGKRDSAKVLRRKLEKSEARVTTLTAALAQCSCGSLENDADLDMISDMLDELEAAFSDIQPHEMDPHKAVHMMDTFMAACREGGLDHEMLYLQSRTGAADEPGAKT